MNKLMMFDTMYHRLGTPRTEWNTAGNQSVEAIVGGTEPRVLRQGITTVWRLWIDGVVVLKIFVHKGQQRLPEW